MDEPELDLDFARNRFPALTDGYIFLDNAGGSQTLKPVVDRLSRYLLTSDVQLGATYEISRRAQERVDRGARWLATFVNAAGPEEIVLGSSSTLLLKLLSLGLVEGWQPGDEIIVTNCDHEANISPWRHLAARGLVVKTWRIDAESHTLNLDDLAALLGPKTRLVAVCHVSNILGTLNPVAEIAAMAHTAGALVCVDGVAYAPHLAIDVRAWNVDFYVFSCYKVFGPHYSLLYGKKALLESLPGFNLSFITSSPAKLQPGNLNYELTYSMLGLRDYLRELVAHHYPGQAPGGERETVLRAFDLISRHEAGLADRLLRFLRGKPGVTIIGNPHGERRLPTISFTVAGKSSDVLTRACDPHRVGIRYGDFYAKSLIRDLGLEGCNGVVRVSMVHYNTEAEIDRLAAILDQLL